MMDQNEDDHGPNHVQDNSTSAMFFQFPLKLCLLSRHSVLEVVFLASIGAGFFHQMYKALICARNWLRGFEVGVSVRVPIRVRFGSIRVSGFPGQRFQPHSDICKLRSRFGSDLCGFGSGSDNPLKLFLKFKIHYIL